MSPKFFFLDGKYMSIVNINSWADFAQFTVISGDLDPMYDLMSKLPLEQRELFALHFFMFYDAGEAAKAMYGTDQNSFWEYVDDTYATTRRGTERRHFRGDKGLEAIKNMRRHGTPSTFWSKMYGISLREIAQNVTYRFRGNQIGPYFIWKAMDIFDRCLGMPVKLSMEEVLKFMPDEPRKCAEVCWPGVKLEQVVDTVVGGIKHLPAPGVSGRNCHYSEAETVLCMIKGYFLTGSHTLGDDVDEKHRQLAKFPDLCTLLPPKQDWKQYVKSNTVVTPFISA